MGEFFGVLVGFWSWGEEQQRAILPVLQERKYDFPDGDLITDDPLELLLNAYHTELNSLCIRLPDSLSDLAINPPPSLAPLLEALLQATTELIERLTPIPPFTIQPPLPTPDLETLRTHSQTLHQTLKLQPQITPETIQACINSYLHP